MAATKKKRTPGATKRSTAKTVVPRKPRARASAPSLAATLPPPDPAAVGVDAIDGVIVCVVGDRSMETRVPTHVGAFRTHVEERADGVRTAIVRELRRPVALIAEDGLGELPIEAPVGASRLFRHVPVEEARVFFDAPADDPAFGDWYQAQFVAPFAPTQPETPAALADETATADVLTEEIDADDENGEPGDPFDVDPNDEAASPD